MKRLSTQNNTQVIKTIKSDKDRRSHKEVLYLLDQITCLRSVLNKLVKIL